MSDSNPYTPPGAELTASEQPEIVIGPAPAGFWIRLGAFFLDGIFLVPVSLVSFANLFLWKSLAVGLLLHGIFPLYKISLEARFGATLGKKVLGLRVIDGQGNVPGFGRAALRFCSWLPSSLIGIAMTILQMTDPEFLSVESLADFGAYEMPLQNWSTVGTLFSSAACLVVLFNPMRRALHDYLAGTRCIRLSKRT